MPLTRRHKRHPRTRITGGEGVVDFLTDFIGLRPGAGTQPRNDFLRCSPHGCHRRLQHARIQAAPTRVGHRYLATIAGGKYHRQAVGGEDGEHRAGRARHRGIGFGLIETRLDGHGDAMHLSQPAG